MKKMIITMVMIGLTQLVISVDNKISIKQIANEFKSAKSTGNQKVIIEKLTRAEIKSEQDIDLLAEIIRVSEKDKDGQNEALNAVITVCDNQEYKIYEDKFIKLLDDSDKMVRITAIGALGLIKSEKSVPHLRKILKDISKTKYNVYKVVSYTKALETVYEPGVAAISLGQLKDTASIPFIVENYDYLSNFAGDALVMMGREGVKAILEISKNAKEGEPKPIQALCRLNDPSAKDVLVQFLNDDKNDIWLRSSVLRVLVMNLKDETVLSELKKNYSSYDSSLRWDIVEYSNKKEDIEFLLWILENENKEGIRSLSINNIGKVGDPSLIPLLEKFLSHSKVIRNSAKQAIEDIKNKR